MGDVLEFEGSSGDDTSNDFADVFDESPPINIGGRTTKAPDDSTLSGVDDTSNRSSSIKADKNDLGSFIRDLGTTTLTTIGKQAASDFVARLTKKAGPGSSPIRQGPTGRPKSDLFANGTPSGVLNFGGVPISLSTQQIQKRAMGQPFNLTKNQRAILTQAGVKAPKTINFSASDSGGGGSDSTTMLYFLLAGAVVFLFFLKK